MRRKWANFFRDYDVLLCPAAASAAQPHDQLEERFRRSILVDGARIPATDQLFWAGIATLAGLPASEGRLFGEEQIEARAMTFKAAYRVARNVAKECLGGS